MLTPQQSRAKEALNAAQRQVLALPLTYTTLEQIAVQLREVYDMAGLAGLVEIDPTQADTPARTP